MRMRLLILLVMSVSVLPLLGQTDYFQKTESGNKIGAWPQFHLDSSINRIDFYGEPTELLIQDKAIAFQLGLNVKDGFHDTTILQDNLEYSDLYQYNSHPSLNRIWRIDYGRSSIYLYGANQEIGLLDEVEDLTGTESETRTIHIQLYNFTDETIKLQCASPDAEVSIDSQISLPPKDTTVIIAQITLPVGVKSLFIELKNPNISVGLEFEVVGYSSSSNYFNKSEIGFKIGKWPKFYGNGLIERIDFYGSPTVRVRLSKEQMKMLNLQRDNLNPMFYGDNLIYNDLYEYNRKGGFLRIKRNYTSSRLSMYIYGENQEIGLLNEIENIFGRESETKTIKIELYNFTEEPIELHCGSADPEVYTEFKINLPPNDTTVIAAQITLPHGEKELFIQLKNPSISIEFEFEAYGYTLTSKDFQLNDELVVQEPRVQYHRTGNEAKLSILNYSKSEVVLEHSLAKRKSEIDLKELKSGKYWIEIVDFSSDKKIVKPLKLDY